jgi:hypothetical protein
MTDPFGGVYESVTKLIADSATWRIWTDTDTQAEALAFVLFSEGEASDLPNPVAIVFSDSEFEWDSDSCGVGLNFPPSPKGTIQVLFIADIPSTYLTDVQSLQPGVANWQISDRPAAERWFMSQCGNVIAGMVANSGKSGYLVANKFRVMVPLSIPPTNDGNVKPYAMMTWGMDV